MKNSLGIVEIQLIDYGLLKSPTNLDLSLWRNRLARSAVNRKVVGSSPTGDVSFVFFYFPFVLFLASK